MKRFILVLAMFTSVLIGVVSQQVRFGDLNINASGELLFTATTEMPGLGQYGTTLFADIPGASMRQLTVFPERMHVVPSSGVIQIQNRYGLFRTREVNAAPATGSGRTRYFAIGYRPIECRSIECWPGPTESGADPNPYLPPRPEIGVAADVPLSRICSGKRHTDGKDRRGGNESVRRTVPDLPCSLLRRIRRSAHV